MKRIFCAPVGYAITENHLRNLPTLLQGHTNDLKIDTGTFRVWLSRMTLLDYGDAKPEQDFPIEYERLIDGSWVRTNRQGRPL